MREGSRRSGVFEQLTLSLSQPPPKSKAHCVRAPPLHLFKRNRRGSFQFFFYGREKRNNKYTLGLIFPIAYGIGLQEPPRKKLGEEVIHGGENMRRPPKKHGE